MGTKCHLEHIRIRQKWPNVWFWACLSSVGWFRTFFVMYRAFSWLVCKFRIVCFYFRSFFRFCTISCFWEDLLLIFRLVRRRLKIYFCIFRIFKLIVMVVVFNKYEMLYCFFFFWINIYVFYIYIFICVCV
jgi:hypothetical protein